MLDRAVAREALLKEEVASLQAQLRLREQQLFGRKGALLHEGVLAGL
jgi:hypothetical protein